jgi:phospholipid/cholesterol/gamma-HCH transport system substrate-binding protein
MVRTLDGLLKENHDQIARLVVDVDKLTLETAGLVRGLHQGVGDGAEVKRTLANLEALSASIRRDVDPLLARAKAALAGVESATSALGPEEKKKIGRALDEVVTVGEKVQGIATDAQALVADQRRGKGTAGAFLVEQQIYDDVKEMVRDLKRNPWKFFWKE